MSTVISNCFAPTIKAETINTNGLGNTANKKKAKKHLNVSRSSDALAKEKSKGKKKKSKAKKKDDQQHHSKET